MPFATASATAPLNHSLSSEKISSPTPDSPPQTSENSISSFKPAFSPIPLLSKRTSFYPPLHSPKSAAPWSISPAASNASTVPSSSKAKPTMIGKSSATFSLPFLATRTKPTTSKTFSKSSPKTCLPSMGSPFRKSATKAHRSPTPVIKFHFSPTSVLARRRD